MTNLAGQAWGLQLHDVFAIAYLNAQGYSDQHLQKYVNAGWIERIGGGAYKKPNDFIDWSSGLQAIQEQLETSVHVGGRTALALGGKAQYLELGRMTLFLYALSGGIHCQLGLKRILGRLL